MSPDARRLTLCGFQLDALTFPGFMELLATARKTGQTTLILNHNLHSLYLSQRDAAFREAYTHAHYVYIDGMPVVWLAKLAGLDVDGSHRFTLMDKMDDMLAEAARQGWRVFYLGGKAEVLEHGLALLRERHPRLTISGHHGYFAKAGEESAAVIEEINGYAPDVLFVGMGMPLQELWLARFLPQIHVPAITTCGATLEYTTGDSYRPPRWAGPLGMAWLFRLLKDPQRLWRRYLYEPFHLLRPLLGGALRQRLQTRRQNPAQHSASSLER